MIPQTKCSMINAKRKEDRKQLKDWYVRSLFVAGTQLKAGDIPQSVIDCKRVLIMLKRLIKEKRNSCI